MGMRNWFGGIGNAGCSTAIAERLEPRLMLSADFAIYPMANTVLNASPGEEDIGRSMMYQNVGTELGTAYVRSYLSTDATVTTSDPRVYSGQDYDVPVGGYGASNPRFDAPATPGTYYLRSRVGSTWGELVTVNVVEDATPAIVVTDLTASETSLLDDQPYVMTATVSNTGTADMYGAEILQYRRGTQWSTSWNLFGSFDVSYVPAGGSVELRTLSRASHSYQQIYQYRWRSNTHSTDFSNVVAIDCDTAPWPYANGQPDLICSITGDVPAQVAPGERIPVALTATNAGNNSCGSNGLWLYRSTSPDVTTDDTALIGDRWFGRTTEALMPGGSDTVQAHLVAPSQPGTYYFAAFVDVGINQIAEAVETNNRSNVIAITVASPNQPEANVDLTFLDTDGNANMQGLNEQGYIEVSFVRTEASTVDGGELALDGAGAAGVTFANPVRVGVNTYRYAFQGEIGAGPVDVDVVAGTFKNADNDPNAAKSDSFLSLPDISPFQLSTPSTEYTWDAQKLKFEWSGDFGFGMKPAAGPFHPLLTVTGGQISFDGNTLTVGGNFTTSIGGYEVSLMQGDFVIPVGQKLVQALNDATPDEVAYEVAGCKLHLSSLQFVTPQGAPVSQTQLEIQGSVKLPDNMGGSVFSIDGDHKLVIKPDGSVELDGGAVTLPDLEIYMFDGEIRMDAVNMSLTYNAEKGEKGQAGYEEANLQFRGKVSLPNFYNATADFTGADSYIQVTKTGDVEWFGTLSVEDIVIVPKRWEINKAKITMTKDDQGNMKTGGELKLTFPPGIALGAELGFINGDFNFVAMEVDNLSPLTGGYPIGTTGAFLQRIKGKVDHISQYDAAPILYGGEFDMTAGPKVSLSLPDWAGGDIEGALIDLTLGVELDENHLAGSGAMLIAGGLATGGANAELNWQEGFLQASGNLDVLDGLLTLDGQFRATSDYNISMSGTGKVGIPNVIPIYGGTTLGTGDVMLRFTHDFNHANDFIAGWATIPISKFGLDWTLTAGIQVNLDGTYQFLGGKEVSQLTAPAAAAMAAMAKAVTPASAAATLISADYHVEPDTAWLLMGAEWDNDAADTPLQVTDPDGRVYTEADIAASDDIAIVDKLSNARKRTVVVRDPDPGQWTVTILSGGNPSGTPLSNVTFAGYVEAEAPTIDITAVTVSDSKPQVAIEYTAFDADSDAAVSFYYDTDAQGADGVLIADGLVESDGAGALMWNTRGVGAGTYYVYAVAHDGENIPVCDYWSQPVTIAEWAAGCEVRIGAGGARVVRHGDGDGTLMMSMLFGGGSALVGFTGDALPDEADLLPNAAGTVDLSDFVLEIDTVLLDGTGRSSTLLFVAVGGTEPGGAVGSILCDNSNGVTESLNAVIGPTVDLQGDVAIEGPTNLIRLRDVTGGHDIEINTAQTDVTAWNRLTMMLGCVRDTGVNTHGVPITLLRSTEYLNTDGQADEIVTPRIGLLQTTARVANAWTGTPASAGHFQADLDLTGTDALGRSLGSAIIAGTIACRWQLAGSAGLIHAAATGADWQLVATGSISSLFTKTAMGGAVTAAYINAAITLGSLTANLTLTGQNARGVSLGVLVAGQVLGDPTLRAAGVINLVRVWEWLRGRIDAGGLNTLLVVGNRNPAVALDGNFGATVNLDGTGVAAWAKTFGAATIFGNLTGEGWDITGGLGRLYVMGCVKGSAADPIVIRTTDSMTRLMAGTFDCADFLAGIDPSVTDRADQHEHFVNPSARIGSIIALGTGSAGGRGVVDSRFSAAAFGVVRLVNAVCVDHELGLWCRESVESDWLAVLVYRDTGSGEVFAYSPHWGRPYTGPAGLFNVILPMSYGNDDFADRAVFGEFPVIGASNEDATNEAGEPQHANQYCGRSVWWTWTAPVSGPVGFHTEGSTFDTVLAVYTGSSISGLTEVASNDDAHDDTLRSAVSFNAVAGQSYHIAVAAYLSHRGNIRLERVGP